MTRNLNYRLPEYSVWKKNWYKKAKKEFSQQLEDIKEDLKYDISIIELDLISEQKYLNKIIRKKNISILCLWIICIWLLWLLTTFIFI